MPSSLTGRIVAAFAILAIALWLAIGTTMFLVLRGLHAEATSSALGDIAQTFAVRIRGAVATGDVRNVVNQIRKDIAGGDVTIQLLATDGSIVELGAPDPRPQQTLDIPTGTRIGDTLSGSVPFSDGNVHDYAALVLRGPGAPGPRAVLLSTVDRSAAAAIRDVGRSLPVVILATLLVGAPMALLLSRSVGVPIARVSRRARELVDPSNAPVDPLPESGPQEVRQLTAQVNAMGLELARTRARESELLADLRHDLRTPLTVIAGYAAALADGTATGDAASRAAAAIAEESARLERMVATLGSLDRLRTEAGVLHLEPVDALDVLRATAERFEARAAASGINLTTSTPTGGSEVAESRAAASEINLTTSTAADGAVPSSGSAGPPLSLVADRLALDRILGNVVENAIAALPAGGTIKLEARPTATDDPAASAVAFVVADDGPGFPPGGIDRAFDRFYRGDASRAGPGSGLGLAIVRELARAHGGDAIAENVAPHGARITVVLPITPPAPTSPEAMTAAT